MILALAAVLIGVALLAGGGSEDARPAGAGDGFSSQRIALVKRRVEALRGLRFRRPVPVSVVSPAEARDYAAAEERRHASGRERAMVEAEKLQGLLEPDADVDAIVEQVFEEEVAGFYDSRRERLVLVRGVGVDEVTLAHELTHALEDQHYDLDDVDGRPYRRLSDDALVAYTSLLEGTATEVMIEYLRRYPGSGPDLGAALGSLGASPGSEPLPPYVMRGLLFPYVRGQTFVAALRHGEPGWELVDNALRYRPPASTAEVLEPERWLRLTKRAPVALPEGPPEAGWEHVGGSTFGQFETSQLLYESSGARRARRIAAGWEGGRWALWRQGGWAARGCKEPCRERDALTVGWRMADPAAAGRLAAALELWRATLPPEAVAEVVTEGRGVRVALAPDKALAERLAGG